MNFKEIKIDLNKLERVIELGVYSAMVIIVLICVAGIIYRFKKK
ncbi:hypothetical protein [Bacillus wiedmannii]|nr:hypothetical protein [Bacillus wiedmannii]